MTPTPTPIKKALSHSGTLTSWVSPVVGLLSWILPGTRGLCCSPRLDGAWSQEVSDSFQPWELGLPLEENGERPTCGFRKNRMRLKDARHRTVDFQASCRKGMVLGKREQLAGGSWRRFQGYFELPWDRIRDSPSVLASPWPTQDKAQVCR